MPSVNRARALDAAPEEDSPSADSTNPNSINTGLLLSLASSRAISAANHALGPVSLNARSYSLLEAVERIEGASQRRLADDLRLDPSQIVSLVDGLESRGLVERKPNPTDRRQWAVVSTAAGRALHQQARDLVNGSLEGVLVNLEPDERAQLWSLLRRIV